MSAVREVAAVTVSKPVDGRKRRRRPTTRKPRSTKVDHIKVLPEVWSAAVAASRIGERLVIVSETEVLITHQIGGGR